jgi:hypothetical protein
MEFSGVEVFLLSALAMIALASLVLGVVALVVAVIVSGKRPSQR